MSNLIEDVENHEFPNVLYLYFNPTGLTHEDRQLNKSELSEIINKKRHFDTAKFTFKYGIIYKENENPLQKTKELIIKLLNKKQCPFNSLDENFPFMIKISRPMDYYSYQNFILSAIPLKDHAPINKAYQGEKIEMIYISTLVNTTFIDNHLIS